MADPVYKEVKENFTVVNDKGMLWLVNDSGERLIEVNPRRGDIVKLMGDVNRIDLVIRDKEGKPLKNAAYLPHFRVANETGHDVLVTGGLLSAHSGKFALMSSPYELANISVPLAKTLPNGMTPVVNTLNQAITTRGGLVARAPAQIYNTGYPDMGEQDKALLTFEYKKDFKVAGANGIKMPAYTRQSVIVEPKGHVDFVRAKIDADGKPSPDTGEGGQLLTIDGNDSAAKNTARVQSQRYQTAYDLHSAVEEYNIAPAERVPTEAERTHANEFQKAIDEIGMPANVNGSASNGDIVIGYKTRFKEPTKPQDYTEEVAVKRTFDFGKNAPAALAEAEPAKPMPNIPKPPVGMPPKAAMGADKEQLEMLDKMEKAARKAMLEVEKERPTTIAATIEERVHELAKKVADPEHKIPAKSEKKDYQYNHGKNTLKDFAAEHHDGKKEQTVEAQIAGVRDTIKSIGGTRNEVRDQLNIISDQLNKLEKSIETKKKMGSLDKDQINVASAAARDALKGAVSKPDNAAGEQRFTVSAVQDANDSKRPANTEVAAVSDSGRQY